MASMQVDMSRTCWICSLVRKIIGACSIRQCWSELTGVFGYWYSLWKSSCKDRTCPHNERSDRSLLSAALSLWETLKHQIMNLQSRYQRAQTDRRGGSLRGKETRSSTM